MGNLQAFYFLQAFQIISQRIRNISPYRDIRCDIKKDMVTGEKDFFVFYIKAGMSRCVPRCMDTSERDIRHGEHIIVAEQLRQGMDAAENKDGPDCPFSVFRFLP